MRIVLVAHGLPPQERAGVETHCEALARNLARAGSQVAIFAPRRRSELPHLSERREVRTAGGGASYAVHWLTCNTEPEDPLDAAFPVGVAERFGAFLDRERPDVLHVHHLLGLGFGILEAAHARAVPTVWTAHDYFAVCHRANLLRPDLSRCTTVGNPSLCARCDAGVSHLNRIEELGDYHAGVAPADLEVEAREELASILAGEPGPFDQSTLANLGERRHAADRRRAAALAGLGCILSPTRFLAERLLEGGLPAERIREVPYAIPGGPLRELAPPRAGRGPVRLGFVGSVTKHKGLHVLIEAFRNMSADASLAVFGDSNDRVYVDRVRRAADSAGVAWHGAFDARDRARVFAAIDVLVVPSIWFENQPFVIREAFAARRPVIASRVGALPEYVRDGTDGLLFEPGDDAELRAALERAASEEGLVERWSAALPQVPDLEEQTRELLELYASLRNDASIAEPRTDSLGDLSSRVEGFTRMPMRGLLEQTLRRLGDLRRGLPVAESPEPEEILLRCLDADHPVQQALRDAEGERSWLRGRLEQSDVSRRPITEEVEWLRSVIEANREAEQSLVTQVQWLEETASGRDRALSLERERATQLDLARASLEKERVWLQELLEGKEREVEWVKSSLESLTDEMDRTLADRVELEKERDWQQETLAGLESERAWLRQRGEELDRRSSWQADTLESVERERDWLRARVEELDERSAWQARSVEGLEEERTWLRGRAEGLDRELTWLRETASATERELGWRREQMQKAESEGGGLFRFLLSKSSLGRRLRGWRASSGDGSE